jgi:hypothetical protein
MQATTVRDCIERRNMRLNIDNVGVSKTICTG